MFPLCSLCRFLPALGTALGAACSIQTAPPPHEKPLKERKPRTATHIHGPPTPEPPAPAGQAVARWKRQVGNMEALPGLPTSSCFCSRPLTTVTVPPLFPAALGRAERQVCFCRLAASAVQIVHLTGCHWRSMRLSNESTVPTFLCFLELGSRCWRPKQTEDRMDLSLTLPCVASGKAAATSGRPSSPAG